MAFRVRSDTNNNWIGAKRFQSVLTIGYVGPAVGLGVEHFSPIWHAFMGRTCVVHRYSRTYGSSKFDKFSTLTFGWPIFGFGFVCDFSVLGNSFRCLFSKGRIIDQYTTYYFSDIGLLLRYHSIEDKHDSFYRCAHRKQLTCFSPPARDAWAMLYGRGENTKISSNEGKRI